MSGAKKLFFIAIVVVIAAIIFVAFKKAQIKYLTVTDTAMKISSPAFENNSNIPAKYTCDGENTNPALKIDDVPQNAKSLVLILDDPDAPIAGGFVHWVVLNIDPATKEIAENSSPAEAIEGKNSSDMNGYLGPCPPSGKHRYQFKLYALDIELSLDSSATRENVESVMDGHILGKSLLVGLYERQ